MRNPRDPRSGKKGKGATLPPGGGAAARARQFALERGLEPADQKRVNDKAASKKSSAKKTQQQKT